MAACLSFVADAAGVFALRTTTRASFAPWWAASAFHLRPALSRALSLPPSARAGGGGKGGCAGSGGMARPPVDAGTTPADLYAASPELDELLLRPSDAPVLAHIVSYNVLSSSLAGASHFPSCDPGDLDAHTRLARILAKLEEPVASRAVICLQEVSLSWTGPLHAFFASRHFHFVVANYGSYFNGYMGVALAFPIAAYDVLDVKVERLTDSHRWPPRHPTHVGVVRAVSDFRKRVCGVWEAMFGDLERGKHTRRKRGSQTNQVWNASRDKRNMMIFARLRSKTNGARICVGTYHMPCAFYSPPQMIIHSSLVVSRFQDLCADDHGVLAGDFNIKPGDSSYNMILSGKVDRESKDFPKKGSIFDGSPPEQWMPKLRASMKSAYKEVLGHEPDFTNYAQVETQPPFIETLDYIFCTTDVDVVDVVRLPNRKVAAKGPYPAATEPSDHVLVGATLRLPPPARRRK